MVVVVGDQHLGRVGGDAARVGELPGFAALRAPLERFAAGQVEPLDAVVAGVGDVHVFARDRDAAARGLGVVLGGAELELPESAAGVPPGGQEVRRRRSNFSMRLWAESTTYTLPAASVASPPIGPNWPCPPP